MCRGKISHNFTLMVIDDFDVLDAVFIPFKADPPLPVDTDGVLAIAVPAQRFQAVGRRDAKIRQGFGKMQHDQLARGQPLNVLGELFRKAAMENLFGLAAFE